MTHDLDIEPILDRWLTEGTDVLPDRSVEAVLRSVDRTRQRRALGMPWRTPDMDALSRPALLASATLIVVLAVGGLVYLGGRGPSTGGPAPTGATSPSPSPATSPSPAAASPIGAIGSGPLGPAIVALDGTVRQDLRLPPDAWSADLSPDGGRVVFSTVDPNVGFCGGCVPGIRRPTVVGLGATQGSYVYPHNLGGFEPGSGLEPDTGTFTEFAWSPDGQRLAYQATDATGNRDIYVLDVDTSPGLGIAGTERRLTTDPAVDEFPAWTPDGSTILYSSIGATEADGSGFSPTQEIWSVAAHGGKPRRLTDNDVADTMPDVAPDGTVAYWSDGQIRAMALDGTADRMLTPAPPSIGWFNPRWSPDGSKLAVLAYNPGRRASFEPKLGLPTDLPLMDVYVIDIPTGEASYVGQAGASGLQVASDFNPVSWTPDGTALLIDRYDAGP
jgi:dipeptidyl aminopeptidase/acylaminoacyl peptidase